MKFRKKPVIVEAFQMTLERRWDNREWPDWLNRAWNHGTGEGALWIDPDDPDRSKLVVGTLQGTTPVDWGDWIISCGEDDLFACKNEIFLATYEPVE